MSTVRTALTLAFLAGPSSGCFIDEGCSDTADPDFLKIDLDHEHKDGAYEVAATFDGQTATCTYTWDEELDSGDSHLTELSCHEPGSMEIYDWEAPITLVIQGHPASVDLRVSRDGTVLIETTLTPDYEVSGGERCGYGYWDRLSVSF